MSKFYRGVSTRSSLKLKKTKLNKKKRHPKSREIETPKEPEPMPVKEQEKLPEKEPEKIPEKEPERLPVEKSMTIKTEEDVKQEKPIRRRLYRCCVPHCTTYATSDQFVPFPSDDYKNRRIWMNAIPRKNWLISHNTLICKYHFVNEDLSQNSAPTMFLNPVEPNLEDKYRKIDRGMFQISSHYALPETFGDLAKSPNCDKFIFDFSCLVQKYKEQLKAVLEFCKWLSQEHDDKVLFYKTAVEDGVAKIPISVAIDNRLRPTIALDGVIVDPLDFTRHVPVNGRIGHWDQLNSLLLDYGFDRPLERRAGVGPSFLVPSRVVGSS